MGVESDEEVLQLVGTEGAFATLLTPTLQHCKEEGVYTRQQALDYLAARVKGGGRPGAGGGGGFQRRGRSKVDETREVLANVVLCHVPVTSFDYQQKASGVPAWHCQRASATPATGWVLVLPTHNPMHCCIYHLSTLMAICYREIQH
jgi:hypothetical protein